MISRRTFLSRVAGGVVASAVIAHIPIQFIPESVRGLGALDYLLKEYRKMYQGVSQSQIPRYTECGQTLFDAFETELIPYQRWGDTESYRHGYKTRMFKNVVLRPSLDGWCVNFTPPLERAS